MLTVLHISTADNIGGSGRSAYRVHTGLRRLGVRSRMLVGLKTTDDEDVDLIATRRFWMLDRAVGKVVDSFSLQHLFYPSSFFLPRRQWFKEADVVQFYNTHGSYFSHTVLPILSRRKPLVWRLSDMWPMTGHCAYSFDCERWKTGCGSCPILSDYPALSRDTTALLWRVKRWLYDHSSLTIVAPSSWIAGLAKESPLLGRFPTHVIPNGLDTEVFRPVQKEAAREVLGIGGNRRVVLFSTQFVTDRRKGGSLMQEALERLALFGMSNVTLLIVGAGVSRWEATVPIEVKQLEHVNNDTMMAAVYSAADVFVLPTLAENLPNGVIESMACGTPPVTFNVGGCVDAVRHMETGYVAAYKDADDLTRGIRLLLSDDDVRMRLGRRGREVVEAEYSLELQARRYIGLYLAMLSENARNSDF